MSHFNWDGAKNEKLIAERGISFEEIVFAIENNKVLDIAEHPNPGRYPNQRMLVVEWNNYAYLVPFVINEGFIFLKTIIPSRKAAKKYLKGRQP